jgi:hypothetical protein
VSFVGVAPLFDFILVKEVYMLDGITLDTATVLEAGGMVVAAFAAIWAVSKVISMFRK